MCPNGMAQGGAGDRMDGANAGIAWRDYSLTDPEAGRAIAKGRASAEWYRADMPRTDRAVIRFDHDGRSAAVHRDMETDVRCTDGLWSPEQVQA